MRFVETYFVKGPINDRNNRRINYSVKDPPVAGHSCAFILDDGKRMTLFHPFTLQGFKVNESSMEIQVAKDLPYDPKRMAKLILQKWEDYKHLEMQRDYHIAAAVLLELGAEVPEEIPIMGDQASEKQKKRGGKPFDQARFKILKTKGKRADIARFFFESASVMTAMAKLKMTRSGVLSHLFCIWRDHGIGYEVNGDNATLLVPNDLSIFPDEIEIGEEDFLS